MQRVIEGAGLGVGRFKSQQSRSAKDGSIQKSIRPISPPLDRGESQQSLISDGHLFAGY